MSGQVSEAEPPIRSHIGTALPETYNGWHRLNHDDVALEYWRSGSTHVSGRYEQLAVTETTDGRYTLSKTVYNQFNHVITSNQIIRGKKPADAGFLWNRMKSRMGEFQGGEEFDGPPELPGTVGGWVLTERRYEGDNRDAVRWENQYATVTVEEMEIKDLYCRTKREFAVRYETPEETENLVQEVPRTAAFEVAEYIMRQLKKPARDLVDLRTELASLTDIGPQRSLRLLRLGILDERDLAMCVSGTHLCNYHHTEEVQKVATTRLEDSLPPTN